WSSRSAGWTGRSCRPGTEGPRAQGCYYRPAIRHPTFVRERMNRNVITFVTALAAACFALAAPQANAETQVNASGACKSALPVLDGNIRSRPLGVRNEGTSHAFVSCSLPAEHGSRISLAGIFVTNSGSETVTVNCTMVNGRQG